MLPDNPLRKLAAALEDLCARDGRQKREIAAASGISPAMLSAYVTGRKEPSVESLGRLLAGLGLGLSDLEAALARLEGGGAQSTARSDLAALKAELLAVVDQRMAEFGFQPGGGKAAPSSAKATKTKGRAGAKSRAR